MNARTDEDRLRDVVAKLRGRASRTGSMSALWDVIFDAEAFLEGKPTIVKFETTGEWADYLERSL